MDDYQLFPRFVDEEQFEPGDIISLYDGLIRIIEKDIEEFRSEGKREGWTTYGIFTAIAGAVYAVFGLTKGFNFNGENSTAPPIPSPQIAAVIAFAIILGHFLILLHGIKSGKRFEIKPKRLVPAKEFLKGLRLSFILRIASILLAILLLWYSNIPLETLWLCVGILSLFLLFFGFYFGISFSKNLNLTNLPQYRHVKTILQILFLLGHLIILVPLGRAIGLPVGETLTTAWGIGLPLAGIVIMFEIWISSIPNEEVIRELGDLRDDLILRDRSFNSVLARYAFLKEGVTLLETMRPKANDFLNEFASLDTIYRQQDVILERILTLFPEKKDKANDLKRKTDEVKVQQQSYSVLSNEITRIISRITPEYEHFKEELMKFANQTGDYQQYNYIVKTFTDRLETLKELEKITMKKNSDIAERLKQLTPPSEDSN